MISDEVGAAPVVVIAAARRGPRYVALGLAFLALAFVATMLVVNTDAGTDLRSILAQSAAATGRLRWPCVAIMLACAALHYVAAGIGVRTVMTDPGNWREVALVQLAAAAANRVTPAGLGGSAVNARYFTRRSMPVSAAVGAVATLALLGAVADLITGLGVVGLGSLAGNGGVGRELALLASYGAHLTAPLAAGWPGLLAAFAGLGALLVLLGRRIRRSSRPGWPQWRDGALTPAWRLCRQPGRLLRLVLASAATTLLLGCAFVCSAWLLPDSRPAMPAAGLLIGYLLASAVSSTVPVPAGLGSTEAALAAVLIAARVPAAQAVEQVLLFRIVTFWSPAVLGLLISRRLHRIGVL